MTLSARDKIEILELSGRYTYALDGCLPKEWADVFTGDGEVWADGKLLAAGRTQLEEYMRTGRKLGKDSLRHFTSNAVIEDGDHGSASLRLYVITWDLHGGGMVPRMIGEYNDRLVKVDGQWRFKVRRVTASARDGRSFERTSSLKGDEENRAVHTSHPEPDFH